MKKIFSPQNYKIADEAHKSFVDTEEIHHFLDSNVSPSYDKVKSVVEKSLSLQRLSLEEVAILLNANGSEERKIISDGARELKKRVYGNRIVLFAPLYVGNKCVNDCSYCGFSVSNGLSKRKTLTDDEITSEIEALEDSGHKRIILVYGEHPMYSAQMIADNVRKAYSVKKGNGEIRRININAAPFSVEDFRTIKEAQIGTFQIFQESYDREVYARHHPRGLKSNYDNRLTALDRAMEAGIDDVGIGVLFGLGDWRFEVMGLVRHVNHLEAVYGVGPHTISFPRIKEASGVDTSSLHGMDDDDFLRMIAILRLAVPYTGMILTAREPQNIRDVAINYGVSQIDGGTKIEIGAYSSDSDDQDIDKEQFTINDNRSLSEVIDELVDKDFIPSFCTACYRKGRTGEHFMEFSVPGFIKRFCTPNAIFSFVEYLEDYATENVKANGYKLVEKSISEMDHCMSGEVARRVELIKQGKRDLFM